MLGYRVPAPDEAMLISGGRFGRGGAPFKVITGHGAFVLPFFRKTSFMTLSMNEAEVAETCVTRQGISLNVRAVIAFKVGNDEESIVNAGQRFLSDQDQMSTLTGRQKLATEVLDGSKAEMAKIGLTVDSLQIQSIDDMNSGYIDAMAAPHNAAIQRQAQIAPAQANLAQRQAELRQRQLVAEVIKPAEADAEKVQILAKADAQRVRMQAEAAASNNRIALDRMLIDQLPQIVKEAAGGLAGANINVLNGADGLSEIAAGLVAQGLTILDSVKKNLSGSDAAMKAYDAIGPADNGADGDRRPP